MADEAPRSAALFVALAPIAIVCAVGSALANNASVAAGLRLSATRWALPALVCAALAGLVLARRGRPEPVGLHFARMCVIAALVGLAPHYFLAFSAHHAMLLVLTGALVGLLVAPDVLAVTLLLRASRGHGEAYLFERRGLSRLGLSLFLGAIVVAWGAEALIGAPRTLLWGALLVLAWAPPVFVRAPLPVRTRRVAMGIGLALAGGAGLVIAAAPLLALPPPKTAFEQHLVEPVERPTARTTMWVRPSEAGAIVRVHDDQDLPIYENLDDRRLSDAFVHPVATLTKLERVLVIGGESGGVAEQVLRYPEAREVVHVSLFPGLAQAFRERSALRAAHGGALSDARVRIVEVADVAALPAALAPLGQFHLVVVAIPAPLKAIRWAWGAAGREALAARVAPNGYLVGRLTSVSDTRFPWCFVQEWSNHGWYATGYRVVLPSSTMDEILLLLASRHELDVSRIRGLRVPARTMNEDTLRALFMFGADQSFKPRDLATPCVDDLGIKG